jgi:hypothetical protein
MVAEKVCIGSEYGKQFGDKCVRKLSLYLYAMIIRLAATTDIPEIMRLVTKVIPYMRKAGNLQWGTDYPNPEVFEKKILPLTNCGSQIWKEPL